MPGVFEADKIIEGYSWRGGAWGAAGGLLFRDQPFVEPVLGGPH